MDAAAKASEIAAERNGIVARTELHAAGLSHRQIDGLLARGILVAAHRGVFRLRSVADSLVTRCTAAWVRAGDDAAVDRWSAAVLHGLRPEHDEGTSDASPSGVSLAIPEGRHVAIPGVDLVRRSGLSSLDTQQHAGFRVTTPTRTLIDIAELTSPRQLGFMVDDALRRRLTALPLLRRRVDAIGRAGRAGAGVMQSVLGERDGEVRGSNTFERDVRAALRSAGLPEPVTQHPVLLADGSKRFLDLAYPDALLGIEAVSWEWHAQRSDWAADQERNNGLAAIGWRMVGVTWDQRRHRPDSIASAVRAALAWRSSP